MGISERGWNDRLENYTDIYTLDVAGSVTTALNIDVSQPVVVYSISVLGNTSVASGDVTLRDASSTAAVVAGDRKHHTVLASAAQSQSFYFADSFPKGVVFNNGIVVSASTVTGAINISYKLRY